MGNPTLTDPSEAMKDGNLNQGISTRRFLELGLKALLVAGATKATNVLGQTLPQTYDEIMAAIAKGELTYEQLREIGLNSGSKFNDEQRKVLSAELSRLKTAEVKPKPLEVETVVAENQEGEKLVPLNESPEEKKARTDKEKAIKELDKVLEGINKKFFEEANWKSPVVPSPASIKSSRNKIRTEFLLSTDPSVYRSDIALTSPIEGGPYSIEINYSGEGIVGFWVYNKNGKTILLDGQDRTFLNNGINHIMLPSEVVSIKIGLFTSPSTPTLEVSKFNILRTK